MKLSDEQENTLDKIISETPHDARLAVRMLYIQAVCSERARIAREVERRIKCMPRHDPQDYGDFDHGEYEGLNNLHTWLKERAKDE